MEKDNKIKKTPSRDSIISRTKMLLFRSRKRTIITIAVAAGVLFFAWQAFGQQKQPAAYQTAQVQKGTIIQTVSESGNVTSNSQAGVGSPTTGIIEEMYVKDGDTVTQGENLFKVKSTASAQEIASAWSVYQTSLSNANTANTNKITTQATLEKDRQAVLSAQDAVDQMNANGGIHGTNPTTKNTYTQNEIDAITSTLTSSRETFTADEAKYNQSGQSIAAANAAQNSASLAYQATQDSVVTAPVAGTVANVTVRVGDQITASGGNLSSNNANAATTASSTNAVLSIGNYLQPYIKVQASEVDVPNIHAGQKATVTLDAYSGKTFVGTVDQVDTSGTISSGVVTYNVFVIFIAPPDNILPGMTASVTIQTARKDDVLTIPSAAVQSTNGQSTVRVLKNGKASSVDVTTGLTSDTDTEITSGLSEGDTVITGQSGTSSSNGSTGTSPFGRSIGGFGGGIGGGGRTGGGGRGGN